jgi:8-oxo-dGTP pyrophosphatase MutT (NUDIX family)
MNMLRFRAIGRWNEDAVRVRWTNSTRPTIAKIEHAIEAAWKTAQQPGVQLFDGPMCRLGALHVSPLSLDLTVSRTSYKIFVGTNMHNPQFGDEFGDAALAHPIGLSTSILSRDGFVLLGQRNDRVAYYPGKIHPFAGAAEPNDPLNLFDEVRRELKEELAFKEPDIAELYCGGIAEDRSLRQPEIIFHCRSTRTLDEIVGQLDATEHRAAWSAPATSDAIAGALQNPARFTPVAVATLLLFGRVHFGDAWFDANSPAFTL